MGKILDISHHQGNIDWGKASKELDLVIIRTSYSNTTIDRMHKNYVANAKAYKVPFGHYHYSMFKTKAQALVEAKMFVKLADKDAKFLVLDLEDASQARTDMVGNAQAFIDYVKKATGKKVGLYAGHSFYKEHGLGRIKADFTWIPRYSGTSKAGLAPSMACDIWQYTDRGTVSGIRGPVDLNVLHGSKKLSWFTGGGTVQTASKPSKPAKVTTPAKKPVVSTVKYHTVVSGDTCGALAKKYGVTLAQLKKWNKLDSKYTIYKGKKIRVK